MSTTLVSHGFHKGSKNLYRAGDTNLIYEVKSNSLTRKYVITESELIEAIDEWIKEAQS